MTGRLIVNASNIHLGGGKSLLIALLKAVGNNDFLIVDERMIIPSFLSHIKYKAIKPSIVSRFFAEIYLLRIARPSDIVLCFGNLPPLFRLRSQTIVFVQNRYLIDNVTLRFFSIRTRLRLIVERLWFRRLIGHSDGFIVQTVTMKGLLDGIIKGKTSVKVVPFIDKVDGFSGSILDSSQTESFKYDFIYVASGEPHKNHLNLLKAWIILAQEDFYPTLCLTINDSEFVNLKNQIENQIMPDRLKITNVGSIRYDDIWSLYKQSRALIYPSIFESFGLPLLEARMAGKLILASELDYVRDLLDPEDTFDPESPVSIARAVKRFMGVDHDRLHLCNAEEFLASINQSEV